MTRRKTRRNSRPAVITAQKQTSRTTNCLPGAGAARGKWRDGDDMKKPEQLYTVAQAAEILNTSEKTVRRLINKQELRAIRIGGLVRIDPLDIQDFIRNHRSH